MMVMPIARTIVFSFSDVHLPSFDTTFHGLANFKNVLSLEEFPTVIKNTLVWITGSMILRVFLGFLAALLMDGETRTIRTLRIFALIPWTIPSIVSANSWRWMLRSDFGLVNGFFENVGLGFLARPWLNSAATAMPSVLVAYTWAGFPFVMMLFLAGLQGIPEELYESGSIDGANKIQQFFYITIPSLRSVIIMVVVLEIISAINAFDLLFVLTGGGPGTASEILGLLIYRLGFTRFDFATASAASTLLIVAALVCFLFYAPTQFRKKGDKNI
ncbi:ABC transporter permease [Spirochaetia bacterium]|nr:ABC transporter permease [Spirochaetia bacterium]